MNDMNLSLTEAFGHCGAKPSNRLRGLSAIAADGAVVLCCSNKQFGHPAAGVLRYEARLSRDPVDARATELLGQHLVRARDDALPIRLVIATTANAEGGRRSERFHVRPDLTGKLVKFDGDHFIVDFTRIPDVQGATKGRRK
jgi:hypothetical protein